MIIFLTGTPGTGKDTVAHHFERMEYEWIPINKIVKEKKLWTKVEMGAKVVDLKKLAKELNKRINEIKRRKSIVIEGHLACEIPMKGDYCIILRTNPRTLRKRLQRRGYSKKKIDENVEAEMIDYCTQLSIKNLKCSKGFYEVKTTEQIGKVMKNIRSILKGKGNRFKAGWVDWSKYI